MDTTERIRLARKCIADSQRPENDQGTRLDAAIQALRYLGKDVAADPVIQHYFDHKYEWQVERLTYLDMHAYVLALAQDLLSQLEQTK